MTPTPTPRGDGSVTVVIPTYNRADLLRLTLQSVLAQTLPPAEVIVVDDGSTDSTLELLREVDASVIRNPDGGWGPARGRNAALERVSTEYVAFVDSDDLLRPNALERLRDALAAAPDAPFAFVRGLSARREPDGWRQEGVIGPSQEEQRDLLGSLFARNSVPSSGNMVRTEVARRIGGYDPRVRWAEDHHFWVRAAKLGEPIHVPEIGCVYRRHVGNRYAPVSAEEDTYAILDLAAGDPRLEAYVPERLGVELCERSLSALKARRPFRAAESVFQLALREPHRLRVLRRAVRHYRDRRQRWRIGREVWSAQAELREWLSAY
jgi:glycosyltransferase involved in cell wall biosynthesis